MSCKYCELKLINDDGVAYLAGEDWEDEHGGDGGYIHPDGEDVDVRLEQSICKINSKNIKGAGKYISEYFANCVMPRKELEEKLKKR